MGAGPVLVKKKYTVAALEVFADKWATSCPALEFLQQIYGDSNTLASCKGFRALFELLASVGPSEVARAIKAKKDYLQQNAKGS